MMDLEAIFSELHRPIFRYVNGLVQDEDVAADIVQEAFLRLWRNPLPKEQARPWLLKVATNLVRDDIRTKKRYAARIRNSKAQTEWQPSVVDAPDRAFARSERVKAVQEALELLPERDRQLLMMRHEGFSYAEIAAAVDVKPGSVGTLLARALKRFAKAIDPEIMKDGADDV